ncbi:MAG: Rrf2 family transcriptional regulator [Flavobacteriaceae bacterium]
MLTNSSKYALKAVLFLTLHSDENHKLQVKDICEKMNIPKAYSGKLLQALAKRNIISSTRGPKGGFYVDEGNRKQSIMSIIDTIDGRKKMEACIIGLEDCQEENPCPMHNLIASSRSKMIETFEETTLDDLAGNLNSKELFGFNN